MDHGVFPSLVGIVQAISLGSIVRNNEKETVCKKGCVYKFLGLKIYMGRRGRSRGARSPDEEYPRKQGGRRV